MAIAWVIILNQSSLFATPYAEDLGMSRKSINLVFTLPAMCQLFASMLSGYVFKKIDMHKLMKVSTIVLAVFVYFHSIVTNSFQLYILAIITAVATVLLTIIPLSIILNNWFQEKLGFVTGITFMGSGIGAMILSPLVGTWIGSLGWRVTYKILGVLIGITLISIVFLIIKIHPEEMGLSPYGNNGKDVDVLETIGDRMMIREVLTSIRFWAFLMALVLFSIGGAPLMLILVPHLVDIN